MARHRRNPPGEEVPGRLARYVAAEWPGERPWEEWAAACRAWLEEDRSRRLPFGEAGDRIDVIRERYRLRREAFCTAPPMPDEDDGEAWGA